MNTEVIISIHAPKAGGTTMLAAWQQAYGKGHVLLDYADPPADPSADFVLDPVGWAERRPTGLPPNIKVVHGHFKPQKYDLFGNAFRCTMLRHPVDNLISIYLYWRKLPLQPYANALHGYFLRNQLSIIELARLPIMQNLYSQTYFGGWDMRRLNFVGAHENRTDDLRRLSNMIGVTIDLSLHLNTTEPAGDNLEKQAILSDQPLLRRLRDLLTEDIDFYEGSLGR